MRAPTDGNRSREYWKLQNDAYPFHARRRIGNPRPEHFRGHTEVPYICCPIPDKYALWGFETQDQARLFDSRYPLQQWEDLIFDLLNGQSVVYVCPNAEIAREEFRLFHGHGRKIAKTAEFVTSKLTGFTQTSQVKRGVFIRFTSLSAHPEAFTLGTHAIVKSYPSLGLRINRWDVAQEAQDKHLKRWW